MCPKIAQLPEQFRANFAKNEACYHRQAVEPHGQRGHQGLWPRQDLRPGPDGVHHGRWRVRGFHPPRPAAVLAFGQDVSRRGINSEGAKARRFGRLGYRSNPFGLTGMSVAQSQSFQDGVPPKMSKLHPPTGVGALWLARADRLAPTHVGGYGDGGDGRRCSLVPGGADSVLDM